MSRELIVERPLSIGDIVGRSFRIFRQHFMESIKVLFLPTIFLALGRIALLVGTTFGTKTISHFDGQTFAWLGLAFAGLLALFGALIVFWIRQMGLVRYFLGYSSTYIEGRDAVKDRVFAVVMLSIASMVAIIVSAIFWIVICTVSVPGLKAQGVMPILSSIGLSIGIVGAVLSVIYIGMVSQFTIVGLALQKGELGALITKTASLTAHSFMRSLGFLAVTTIAIVAVSYTLSLPATLLALGFLIVSGIMHGSPESAMPLWLQVTNASWESLINMAVGPIAYICYGLYYTDLCMRQEGHDLIDRLDKVEAREQEKRQLYGT